MVDKDDSRRTISPTAIATATSDAFDYMVDASQRAILFWDVMRQRGNQYREHAAQTVPHVLDFEAELVLDGRRLEKPVNYALVRVLPPKGVMVDTTRRPFVVVDPRAGHGPGIGGFKADSQIGVAFKAGHPCYFIGFLPDPMPGQTIEDIVLAEAEFLRKVIELHPDADGKPCVIGNCQAGWSIMMVAALYPELFGPVIVAGSPLSYWQGVKGKFPMRYSGGLLGGSWLTALVSDLGQGKFDGAWLVQNFENQNPANTLWSKQYDLYSKVDTEAQRYLGFERWWGGHVNLNAEEIQFIVDELFIGNNLAAGRIKTSDGTAIDLRHIRSPIVVFCSKADNITPPQQALGWILDLYDSVHEIRMLGQTIVYTIHETAGHLGIFVSGSVAKKQYREFSSNIDLIDTLPPGLYEAIFENKSSDPNNSDYATGEWIMRCEMRTLDDIRALGGNESDDERRFDCAARISEMNLSLYRTFAQPFVRALAATPAAQAMKGVHPLKLQYQIFSDMNPFMASVAAMADAIKKNRRPVANDNPFAKTQNEISERIVSGLDAWQGAMESAAEQGFLALYGSPALQAAMGIDPKSTQSARKVAKSRLHEHLFEVRVKEIKSRIAEGGLREAVTRATLYVGQQRRAVDERGFEAVRRIRQRHSDMSLKDFKTMLRDQFFMLILDSRAALAAIPDMLPADVNLREEAFVAITEILSARGDISDEEQMRLKEVAKLFGVEREKTSRGFQQDRQAS